MLTYDLIVIGFGKAGKTLAGKLASAGKKLPSLNVAKPCTVELVSTLVVSQLRLCQFFAEKDLPFEEVIATKNTITGRLNGKNYATVAGTGVDIFDAEAHFLSNKVIEIKLVMKRKN